MAREDGDVSGAAPQRGQLDAADGEAEEEVVAEATGLHLAVEVAARGRDDAHVDAVPPARPDALDLAALDGAQELGLQRGSSSPISSMKSVPPWACSKTPRRCASAPVNAPRS